MIIRTCCKLDNLLKKANADSENIIQFLPSLFLAPSVRICKVHVYCHTLNLVVFWEFYRRIMS